MTKFLTPAILLVTAVASSLISAKTTDYLGATSLCYRGEVEYFGCEMQNSNKIASVCAAGNISPEHGYVQYRFGTHDAIDYEFPDKLVAPRGKFYIVDVSRLPDGLGSHLRFASEGYTYVVSNALVPGEIYVEKDGKIVFDRFCKGSKYKSFGNAARHGLEYGLANSIDDLDQHGK